MDIDEASSIVTERAFARSGGETTFSKSDELSVTLYAHLPVELKQTLRSADFYTDSYTGDIDTLTGFALVASVQTCFVWQHAQAVKGTPTCYIFSCPQDDDQTSPPFHCLIPYGPSREPGLILVSLAGTIRLWGSIGIGLAGGDHYSTIQLRLSPNEQITNLVRADARTYLASTTSGSLFRLTLTSAAGNNNMTWRLFARPPSSLSLSRFLPSIFSSSSSTTHTKTFHSQNISALAIGVENSTGGREVWALVDTRVQRWVMKSEGWEDLLLDADLSVIIGSAIRESFGTSVDQDDEQVDLELVDLAIDEHGKLVVLISYAAMEDSSMALDVPGVRRIYALTRLSCLGETFRVDSVRSVPYQSTLSSGAPMHPRIRLVLGGSLASIQFGDVVALCARDSDYRDRLELKSTTDRTLGVGVIQSESTLLILTAATMMKVTIDVDNVLAFDPQDGQAKLIKSTMTQAILYGALPQNPLYFSFPPEIDEESLMRGAEQLSQAVLESDPEVVHKNHDLTAQLTGRKERLSWLIKFLNDNMVVVKMSQRSRQKLATDAEKLYAGHQLWLQHNDLLATNPTYSILHDAVHAYMEQIGEAEHDDVMRAFFRLKIGDIGRLIKKVAQITTQASRATGRNMIEFLAEANRVVLAILRSAFDYREYNLGVYGIVLPMIKPWSSRSAIIDVVLEFFDATTKCLDGLAPGSEQIKEDTELKSQLPELAAILLACFQERLDWLQSPVAAEEVGVERDCDELERKFAVLRPEVFETLRRHGHADAAFTLAEQYRDFSSLASLCHKETVFSPENNSHPLRIQAYFERFKDEFAMELYRWYIQHGELRVMFAQEDAYRGYMDKFFALNPNTAISWIHDLGSARHGAAAAALLIDAEQAANLNAKHFMLSVGKLSYLAQLHETDARLDDSVLDAFHDELDFVSVHEALLEEFKSALSGIRSKQSLENQIDLIVKAKASSLSEKKALAITFRELVRALLQGKALPIEDAVDVLTLKNNASTPEDFATALHLLARVQNLPQNRKSSAFRTVWRRIYIHDDWATIQQTSNISDVELNERFRNTALYATLRAVIPREYEPECYETLRDMAELVPTPAEIASRWPGLSPDQTEALVQDYRMECDQLGQLDLNDIYHRVRELAAQDIGWEGAP